MQHLVSRKQDLSYTFIETFRLKIASQVGRNISDYFGKTFIVFGFTQRAETILEPFFSASTFSISVSVQIRSKICNHFQDDSLSTKSYEYSAPRSVFKVSCCPIYSYINCFTL